MVDEIVKAIEKNSFGIYVGAGLSMGAELPSWSQFLNDLISILEKKDIASNRVSEMRDLALIPSKYLMLAEEIRSLIQNDLEKLVREKFEDKSKQPTAVHDALVKIKSKFIITTNYDTLIERALVKNFSNFFPTVYTYKDASSINYSLWNGDFFVLKAHGDAKTPKEIILTERDYRNIIYNQMGYQSILHAIFSTNSILFLGVSLDDPELTLLLRYIHNIFHGGTPNHYALLPKDKITATEIENWRKDFNIHIITYDPKDNHVEVAGFIDEILKLTGENSFDLN
ncbi:SIR2 family protein [Algoriphagus halophytocola]|uniref:SIR2 family protein n=1 Tax=Algoriphagus halophytocola TaxID=2991499 RepID=A0ABY6MHZ3_9BACT|nr:SIR2 family protein [Algoriphagus sp. TR-M5]UZD21804.1 SIR2 family protein [Algoriphagus sp. TR-M5]